MKALNLGGKLRRFEVINMSVVYIERTIDCIKDNYILEKVTGYEHGVKVFRFKPLNGGYPVDLSEATSSAYICTKSDGKIIGNACEIKDNKILLPLSLQMTTAEGELRGHIEVNFPNGVLKFFGVNFNVFPSEETAEIESTDEFTLLENAIAQAKNAYQIAVENGYTGTETEWLENLKGKNGADGKDGTNGIDGRDGKGISSVEVNSNGELLLTYSNGEITNVGKIKGDKGDDYILTDSDKEEIANIAIGNIVDGNEVYY